MRTTACASDNKWHPIRQRETQDGDGHSAGRPVLRRAPDRRARGAVAAGVRKHRGRGRVDRARRWCLGVPVAGESVDVTMTWLPQAKVLHVADTVWPGSHTFFADGTSVPDWFIQLDHVRDLVSELKPRVIVPGHGAPGDAGMIDAQERYLRKVSGIVEQYCRGGEVPLTDEAKAKLRQEIVNAFPEHRNHIALDISLQLLQMLGPL